MKIAIVNFGCGNIQSILNILVYLDHSVAIVDKPDQLNAYDAMVLPGVGSFPMAMENIRNLYFSEAIEEFIQSGKKVLGICLGMQILFQAGTEITPCKGLGVMRGSVDPIIPSEIPSQNIHVGWSDIHLVNEKATPKTNYRHVLQNKVFYFLHAYCVKDPGEVDCIGYATHAGIKFPAFIQNNNILACQFHPEKSSVHGVHLLQSYF